MSAYTFHRTRVRDNERARAHKLREQGYDDGKAGRPAAHVDADYQRSWRRGREARDDEAR